MEVDFKALSANGMNCVMRACSNGDLDRLKYLLSKGGSLDVLDVSGKGCLHHAATGNHFEVVKYLLDRGMNPNQPDLDRHETPFHSACSWKVKPELIQLFLDAKCDVDVVSKTGLTPFMRCCWHAKIPAIKLLLDAGRNWELKNKSGRTGLDIAWSGNRRVFGWLTRFLEMLERSIENCKKAAIAILCTGKSKEVAKYLNNDVLRIIAKEIWATRRQKVWREDEMRKRLNRGRRKNIARKLQFQLTTLRKRPKMEKIGK